MTFRQLKSYLTVFFLLPFFFASYSISSADEVPAGKIIKLKGHVEVVRAGGQNAEPASVQYSLNVGDTIRTGPDGSASILLADESMIQINKDTDFVLKVVEQKAGWLKMRKIGAKLKGNPSVYQINKGEAWIRNKDKDASFEVKSPSSVAGIRGTDLDLKVGPDGTSTVTVMEGLVLVKNEFGSVDVYAGEQAVAKPGQAPRKIVLVTPADAVQWTVTIPQLIDPGQIKDGKVLTAYNKLMAGEINESLDMLTEITVKSPDNSIAWSLLSLTEILTGKTMQALESAKKSVQTAPDSSMAYVIQSYAYQANFDIDSARLSTKKAIGLDDKNVYALINHAKLLFASDYTDEALSFINKARQIDPNDSEIDNLFGFIMLAQRKSEKAINAFKQAINNDPGNGEAHMGLSLAYMRKGDTATAMEEISTAVLLEPRRALFLSYWAKMLYQVKRHYQALDILKFARQIDPNDPTPDLYSAIIYRDLNQPTEAIESINRAIELNDKKGVYRSRFLLDKDLAVKNVDLSLLYNQLGMDAWSQSKALASVKQDYANFSGHLFLGGALRAQESRSLAAGGELLLARLLQPANLNTFNTFNEYTSFFERPGIEGTISGSIGTHDSHGTDAIVFGAIPNLNLAFNIQNIYTYTDGWRDINNEQTNDTGVIIKWDSSPKDNFMLSAALSSYRAKDTVFPRFEYDSPASPDDSQKSRTTMFEIGYHHNFSPDSDLILLFSHLKNDKKFFAKSTLNLPTDPVTVLDINRNVTDKLPYYQVQGQYLLKMASHRFIMGAVRFWGEDRNNIIDDYFVNNNGTLTPLVTDITKFNMDNSFESYYLQDIWQAAPRLYIEAAAYVNRMNNTDSILGTEWQLNKINPRVGVAWNLTNNDIIRVAAFTYLVPFSSIRFDPMDIAGIPVLRNVQEGSLGQEFDITWEHEWKTGFFSVNAFDLKKEFSHKTRTNNIESMTTEYGRIDGTEAVINQLIGKGYGLAASYRYLDVDDESAPALDRQEHLVSAVIRHVRKNGITVGLLETFRFLDLKASGRDNENIWITDAQIGYEFPKKKGSLTLDLRNIFDNRFNWLTDQFIFTGRAPAREILARLSINF